MSHTPAEGRQGALMSADGFFFKPVDLTDPRGRVEAGFYEARLITQATSVSARRRALPKQRVSLEVALTRPCAFVSFRKFELRQRLCVRAQADQATPSPGFFLLSRCVHISWRCVCFQYQSHHDNITTPQECTGTVQPLGAEGGTFLRMRDLTADLSAPCVVDIKARHTNSSRRDVRLCVTC